MLNQHFGIRHLLAVTTLFAISLAVLSSWGEFFRDGVWVVESISVEDFGGSWIGLLYRILSKPAVRD